MKKKTGRMALSRETLRHLDEERLRNGAAGEITGTYSVTCQNRTCTDCVTGYLASCRCTPYLG
jgi:hypothetical protein